MLFKLYLFVIVNIVNL